MKIQSSNHRFSKSPGVASSVHDQGIVLLHTASGQMFTSNLIGARIWRGLEERLSVELIVNKICSEYPIDLATARKHVARFLLELERQKLIKKERPQ